MLRERHIKALHPLYLSGLAELLRESLENPQALLDPNAFDYLLSHLPKSGCLHLEQDARLLILILDGWNAVQDNVSDHIVLGYFDEWQVLRTPLVRIKNGEVGCNELKLIRIRRDETSPPRLDDSIWMVHELGHIFLSLHLETLKAEFMPALNQIILTRDLEALADRGRSLEQSQRRRSLLLQVWTPTVTQQDWVHELAIDALCLWLMGPAYLHAFVAEYEHQMDRVNPHQVDEHPPLHLRAEVLKAGAAFLGWHQAANDMNAFLAQWNARPEAASASNTYGMLMLPELWQAAQRSAWTLAKAHHLPRLHPQDWDAIRLKLETSQEWSGLELIVASWIQRKQLPDVAALEHWETRMLAEIRERIEL